MSLSQHTLETIFAEIAQHADGISAAEIAESTEFKLPTVRAALSTGKYTGMLTKIPGSRPARYVARGEINAAEGPVVSVKTIEKVVEVERVPYVTEDAQKKLSMLFKDITKLDKDNPVHAIIGVYQQVDAKAKRVIVESLFNAAEYMRQQDFSTELRVDDIKVRKAK